MSFNDNENDITSNDFDYDIYSGGSDHSSIGADVTAGDFDYDVYSGRNAMEYLKKQNEAEAEQRRRASKSAAELRREEYEKKFAGMSADELFGMPEKPKKPEDDFSDFLDADEIERQQEKVREFEQSKQTLPKVESMMPGEDDPSSVSPDLHTDEALEKVNVMLAHARFQREREDQIYHNLGRRRYYRNRSTGALFQLLFSAFNLSDHVQYNVEAVFLYSVAFMLCGGGYSVYCRVKRLSIGPMLLRWGTLGGAVIGIIRRYHDDGDTFLEAIKHSMIELVLLGIAGIVVLAAAFV